MFDQYNIINKTTINNIQLFLLPITNKVNHNIIPQIQQTQIFGYKNRWDRQKRMIARAFLYELLTEKYHVNDFQLAYNQYNKPYLKNHEHICFSFSYASEYILVGLSTETAIGVDIEKIDTGLDIELMSQSIFHHHEIQYYQTLADDHAKAQFFFNTFSLKESIIKAIGTGLYTDIKSINTLDNAEQNPYYQHNDQQQYRYTKLPFDINGHCAYVCWHNKTPVFE